MMDRLPSKHIALLGIGHTNAHVLRMWGMHPIPDTSLTCISDHSVATYSGMLPAVLAGQVPREKMQIDLVRLCASVGARLIIAPVTGIDHQQRELLFDRRPAIAYDVLSIGIGSVPSTSGLTTESEQEVLKIKPMQTFLHRLSEEIQRAMDHCGESPLRIVVVGGGVAGIEISFCVSPFVRKLTDRPHTIQLVTRSDSVLPEALASTRRKVLQQMQRRSISLTTGKSVVKVEPGRISLDDGTTIAADLVIWATGAVAPDALDKFDLPLDERGFIATESSLRSVSGHPIFAVGDTGTIVDYSLPKAGVYAVRQGPVLWENIARTLSGTPLQKYVPQQSFLRLINQGDGTAVGQWKGLSFSGRWVMRLKDSIDSRFMEMYQPAVMLDENGDTMQCRGCGCKFGGDLLESALVGPKGSEIKLEDAAEIGGDPAHPLIASTDFFTSPVEDAFLSGRIAALHSASDIVATGAIATHALANVVLPEGNDRTQQRVLRDFLSGARLEFDAMGAVIVGGHTIVGPRMEIGFTVIGKPIGRSLIRKENLSSGDLLFLTKPLGIGVLLAAHARSRCDAAHFESLVEAMLLRQHELAQIAIDCDIVAGTDVTGFGLAGHLLEMLETSGLAAQIRLDAIPLLPGVQVNIERGIESSLAPDNCRVQAKITAAAAVWESATCKALFDPQTCGGLLLGVAPEQSQRLLQALTRAGLPSPVCIGEVREKAAGEKPLTII